MTTRRGFLLGAAAAVALPLAGCKTVPLGWLARPWVADAETSANLCAGVFVPTEFLIFGRSGDVVWSEVNDPNSWAT